MVGRRFTLMIGLSAVLVGAAACSSGGGATTAPSSAAPSVAASPSASESAAASASASTEPSPSGSAAAEIYEVKAATGSVGAYLTGENGKTLYVYADDVKDSGKSACTGGCASNWPPFTVSSMDELKAGTGVSGKLALLTRDDATMQVTYNGKPVYYFAGDKAAGDTTGQGKAGKWVVAAP